ncbi:MAG: endonuclease MutS2 [Armatimonadota bacterium]|nr:endonuclease MutS2 [Armatimonadota bacterium]MDR7518026.1 endonuclease MutS2 [Armatimonadota bacterium]
MDQEVRGRARASEAAGQDGLVDQRTLRVLEFPKILEALVEATVTPMGRALALALRPTADADAVRAAQQETAEAVRLTAEGEIPLRGARDLDDVVTRADAGAVLEPADLQDVAQTLEVTKRVAGFLRTHRARAPRLAERADLLTPLPDLEGEIARTFDERGEMRDDASPDLRRIREGLREADRRLREALERVLRDPVLSRYLQEALVTTRSQRFVVPVKAEHRNQFPGIVHDVSASGATLFMEPVALVPLGNRRRELEAAEREEILRILRRLSAAVGEAAGVLRRNGRLLGALDLAVAKAALAARLRASAPEVRTDGVLRLHQARHPVLVLTRGDESVVPIDVTLGESFTTLVITGPNTGGKTVALKTIGLLVLMAQAGLQIPALDGSAVPVFARVCADVGDEQSIEQNLSTFSSHMGAIVQMLRRVEPPALVLLDEVGAGTDPTEGVALARAIIERLHRTGAHTVVTTHYNELKMLASTEPGIENASVEFDAETLQPTYRLRIGLPGRSNALIIAERLGLDPAIVAAARSHLGPDQAAIEHVLADLTRDRLEAERDRADAAAARKQAEEAQRRLEAEVERLRAERRQLLAEARRAAEAIVEQTRRRLEAVMAEVRAARTEAAVRRAREHLRQVVEALPTAEPPAPAGEPVDRVEVGQAVFVTPLGRAGVVRRGPDDHGEVEVEVGRLRTRVPREALRRAPAEARREVGRDDAVEVPAQPAVPLSLDVRGQTADEAVLAVDRYLDEAVRARLPQVTVIHGKGTGALRRALHDFLRGHPHVRAFRLGGRGEGEDGATVITLEV